MPAVRYDLDGDSSGLVSSLEDSIRALTATIGKTKDLEEQQKKTESTTQRLIGIMRSGAGAVGALGTAAVGAGTALSHLATDAAEVLGEMKEFSARTNLSIETINGLRFAAAAAGTELDKVIPEELTPRILEAAKGLGDGAEALESLGVKARNANGTIRSSTEIFRDVIDALARMEDRTLAASLADQMFNDQGTEIIRVLRDGSAQLDEFTALAAEYGYHVGPDAVQVTTDWQQGLAALKLGIEDSVQTVLDWAGAVGLSGRNLTFAAAILVHWSSLLREGSALITDTEAALARADERALKFWRSFEDNAKAGTDAGQGFKRTIVDIKDEKLDQELEKLAREADKAAREMFTLEQRSKDFWTSWAEGQREAEMDQAFLPLEAALNSAQAEAEKMVAAVQTMADGVEDALDKLAKRQQQIMGGAEVLLESGVEMVGMLFEAAAEQWDQAVDKLDARIDRQQKKVDNLKERAEEGDQAAREQLATEKEALADMEQARREAARRAFEAEQNMRREQATMAIALAIIQAYAQLGPIGGSIAAFGLGGLLAMQLERINAAQPRHSGGEVNPAGLGADEGMLLGHLMRQGEQLRVISQRGAEMFEAIERGQGSQRSRGGAARLVFTDAGRVLGEALIRESQRPGSRLSSAGSVGPGDPYRRS